MPAWAKMKKENKGQLILLDTEIFRSRVGALVDSGATRSYISKKALQKLRLGLKVQKLTDPIVSILADNRTTVVEDYVEGVQAYFRLEKEGKVEKVLHSLTLLVEDSLPFDIVLGMDWGEAAGAMLHLKEHECRLPSSSGEAKTARLFHVSGVENSLAHCCLSAPAFARLVKKEKLNEQVLVAYVRPVTEPTEEKPMDPAIAKLLEEFKDLTEPPIGVVPRPIQHRIETEPGIPTVAVPTAAATTAVVSTAAVSTAAVSTPGFTLAVSATEVASATRLVTACSSAANAVPTVAVPTATASTAVVSTAAVSTAAAAVVSTAAVSTVAVSTPGFTPAVSATEVASAAVPATEVASAAVPTTTVVSAAVPFFTTFSASVPRISHAIVFTGENLITGTIPSFFGEFKKLEILNLSYNQLTGPIPDSLLEISAPNGSLLDLILNRNNLSGRVPIGFNTLRNFSTDSVEPESQVAFSTCLGGEATEWVLTEVNAAGFDDIGEWVETLNLKQFLSKIKERFLDKTTADKAFDQLTTIGQKQWTSVESLSREVDRLLQVPRLNLQDNQVLYIYSRALLEPIRGQLVTESKSGKYNYRQFRDLALQREQMTSQVKNLYASVVKFSGGAAAGKRILWRQKRQDHTLVVFDDDIVEKWSLEAEDVPSSSDSGKGEVTAAVVNNGGPRLPVMKKKKPRSFPEHPGIAAEKPWENIGMTQETWQEQMDNAQCLKCDTPGRVIAWSPLIRNPKASRQ
ncbi:hypothetical protein CBR_g557 [Chara braunii]|uniref:Uncharacterized protein n=1 Tax=Chara braunii TaxID=69332 RepID=A0A388KBI2_CHABU|nr:hypothetical protein CBR_g557 [Chara braunii]|eukprot:GBG67422.1 hypothetical protein CBR_g557 [Chara braunii]